MVKDTLRRNERKNTMSLKSAVMKTTEANEGNQGKAAEGSGGFAATKRSAEVAGGPAPARDRVPAFVSLVSLGANRRSRMTSPFAWWLCLVLTAGAAQWAAGAESVLSLAGRWRFALDAGDAGVAGAWFQKDLAEVIQLPGALQAQGFGNDISTNTPWVLSLYDRAWFQRADYLADTTPGKVKVPFVCQPPKHYLGPAWYQREVDIPPAWQGRRVALQLERPHWESTVWLDAQRLGACNSLVAPHDYELGRLAPGRHRLTIRVDNRMILPYRPDAHSVSDSLAGSWNGIVGKIELTATSPVWLADVQVYPDVSNRTARVQARIGNLSGQPGTGALTAAVATDAAATEHPVVARMEAAWATNGGQVELAVPLGPKAELWDEFHPALQRLTIQLKGNGAEDAREVVFGLREFKAEGRDFTINGRKTSLRGTHHGGDFPLTGFPPTDVEYWRKLLLTCREWGLNHIRFHSFCPPDAAFCAADALGFYLQPECGMWNEISPGTPMERMLYEETERMVRAYGNHPSFALLSPSNEPKARWKQSLPQWVEHFRAADPRHLYTTGTGWSLIDEPGPVQGADYLAVGRIGLNRTRGNSAWFGRDFSRSLRGVDVPVVAHELGQWCAYPDYAVIGKFTGYLRPGNYEIFRDSLAAHGLLDRNPDLVWASGRLQLACYKEEIEANLRTPGLAGFQLLDLHDYVGQGTALVGLLDPFWEPKGYATAAEFRRFCNSTVPLARLGRRVFTTGDRFEVDLEAAHYGPAPLENAVAAWRILAADGKVVSDGAMPAKTIALGKNLPLGHVSVELSRLPAPAAYRLEVALRGPGATGGFTNDWAFWLYPTALSNRVPADVLVTTSWEEAEPKLAAGGKVLFLPQSADLGWTSPPLDNVPIFWNRLMNPGWGRMLGLWCQKDHPALAEFPTESAGDWQWMELARRARAVNLDHLPAALQPIVQPVDDWNRNYKLGLVFEAKVGPGKLVVCSVDLAGDLDGQPVARQLRRSLLDYLGGPQFQPRVEVSAADLRGLLFNSRLMRDLGATVRGNSAAGAALDGDPNTFWQAGGRGSTYPYTLVVDFPASVSLTGVVLLNRQNHREHEGDIRGYTFEGSADGQTWNELAKGELLSTWEPQTVPFGKTVSVKRLRLTARSGFGNDTTVALAELSVLYAGPPLQHHAAPAPGLQRARSATEEVDEGLPAPSTKR